MSRLYTHIHPLIIHTHTGRATQPQPFFFLPEAPARKCIHDSLFPSLATVRRHPNNLLAPGVIALITERTDDASGKSESARFRRCESAAAAAWKSNNDCHYTCQVESKVFTLFWARVSDTCVMRKAYNNLHFVAHLKDYDLSFEYGVGATRQNRMLYNLI